MTLTASRTKRSTRPREILAAALRSFASHGYATTTIADIRREAQASIGSIYHHFGGKEQLAAALFVEGLRDYQEGLLAKISRRLRHKHPARRTAKRSVMLVVEHYLAWVEANADWARYLLEMGHAQFVDTVRPEIEELNRGFYAELSAWFAPHIERGDLLRLPLGLYLPLLVGPARDFARHWLRRGPGPRGSASGGVRAEIGTSVDIRQARRLLAEAAWKSLRSPRQKG